MAKENCFSIALRDQAVGQIAFSHDYLQVVFESGTTLTVNNKYSFLGGQPDDFDGAVVTGVETSLAAFTMCFGGNLSLSVGLGEEDYFSPEAMVLDTGKGGVFVWR